MLGWALVTFVEGMKIRLRRNLPSDFVRGESMISCNQIGFAAVTAERGGGHAWFIKPHMCAGMKWNYIYFSIVIFTGRLSGVFTGVRMGDHKLLNCNEGQRFSFTSPGASIRVSDGGRGEAKVRKKFRRSAHNITIFDFARVLCRKF